MLALELTSLHDIRVISEMLFISIRLSLARLSEFLAQVLGQTLSKLVRGQVAEAWKAELKAREYETRLLEELEVSLA